MAKNKKLREGDVCPECGNGNLVKHSETVQGVVYTSLMCNGLVESKASNDLEACEFSIETGHHHLTDKIR